MTLVLDADVLIGALDGSDRRHAEARSLLTERHARGEALAASVVTLTEVLVAPAAEPRRLRLARSAIAALGVEVRPAGEAVAVDAARLRRLHPISLPDAYCLATARHTGASVASFDGKVLRAARAEGLAVEPRARR